VRPAKRGRRHGSRRRRGRPGGARPGGGFPWGSRHGGRGRDLVEAELLEELVQGDARDAHAEGLVEEVDQVGASGLGVGQEECDEGPGVAGQELAVGPSVQAVVGLLDGLLGGHPLLAGGGGAADADEAGELGDLEPGAGVEQEVGEQARGVGVVALGLAEVEGGLQHAALVGREAMFGDVCLGQPCGEGVRCRRHGSPSRATTQEAVYSAAAKG
jgi:hypothetical protein